MDTLIWLGLWILKIYGGIAAIVFVVILCLGTKEICLGYKEFFSRKMDSMEVLWWQVRVFSKSGYWFFSILNVLGTSIVFGFIWIYVGIVLLKEFWNSING